jgi:N-glycosylase/DNA lyase
LRGAAEFEPAHIFDNGQCFRFIRQADGAYHGVARGRFLRVEKNGDDVSLFPCSRDEFESIWSSYFDLGRDYAKLFADCGDKALLEGRKYAKGLRVLNQEPFETLISFIISANNNLGRIRGIVERICGACGEPFDCAGRACHAFPTPGRLAALDVDEFTGCGCGYRSPYLRETARQVADGFDLEALRSLPYGEAKKRLMRLRGVGPKVADCVLLFALGKTDAFPADVWIKRVMKKLYGFEGNDRQIYECAKSKFGENAGIAQQYLFYYARENGLG